MILGTIIEMHPNRIRCILLRSIRSRPIQPNHRRGQEKQQVEQRAEQLVEQLVEQLAE